MTQITVSNHTIDVVKKDIKHAYISVNPPNGKIKISAPLRMNDEAIRLFAVSKLPWIKKQQRLYEEQERETPREYVYRETHYFFGKRFLLDVIEHDGYNKIVKNHSNIELYIRKGTSQEKKEEILYEWYRKELKKVIPELLSHWERIVGVKASEWRVKIMKTKWGSCNIETKRIWLNLELAKKPIQCLEYIIVHELVHFLERHHNEKFEKYMDRFMPTWKVYKEMLNRYPLGHSDWGY